MERKEKLVIRGTYHIFNRSIADFKIFNTEAEYSRMKNSLKFFQFERIPYKFSQFIESVTVSSEGFDKHLASVSQGKEKIVQIISYCFMPTHIHLILKQLKENGISIFMGNLLNSYSRYFNTKHRRKGPLWEGKFKNILVETDEQLLHLTRYIHLNPVTAYLAKKPEEWQMSSYHEYLFKIEGNNKICKFDGILDIEPDSYKEFVEDRISYQRELAKIKSLLIEEPFYTPGV